MIIPEPSRTGKVVVTFVDGDTTPSVATMNNAIYKTANTSETIIAGFDDQRVGNIKIIIGDVYTKFQNGATLKLVGGANGDNVTYATNDVIDFVSDGTNSYQDGDPSFNS